MWSTAREIADGDVVIIWLTRDAVQPLTITAGKELNGRFGCYRHNDLIGLPYGSKVACRTGARKGFIHVLRPTPELWTLALPHRTQILYLADIALVTARLGIRPGSRVIEAGTGSGSFTHSVARTIGRTGRLYSFEFHQPRAVKAREEFEQHGMSEYVVLEHRNVCKDGFGLVDAVDSVFLDLPAPWDAIPHAKIAARKDRTVRICCFSPCIEQVLRTVSALNENGFTEITMYETLLRPHEVSPAPVPTPVSSIRVRLQVAEVGKEERRLRQIAASRLKREGDVKRKREEEEEDGGTSSVKKARTDKCDDPPEGTVLEDVGESKADRLGAEEDIPDLLPSESSTEKGKEASSPTPSHIVTQPIKEVRGHTSYLTFACLLPVVVPPLGLQRQASSGPQDTKTVSDLAVVSSIVPSPLEVVPEPVQEEMMQDTEIAVKEEGAC